MAKIIQLPGSGHVNEDEALVVAFLEKSCRKLTR